MASVGIFEAKTHLSKLIERVELGETIEITKNGKAVAQLSPLPVEDRAARTKAAIEELRKFREGHSLDGLSIRELIHEGHKY